MGHTVSVIQEHPVPFAVALLMGRQLPFLGQFIFDAVARTWVVLGAEQIMK